MTNCVQTPYYRICYNSIYYIFNKNTIKKGINKFNNLEYIYIGLRTTTRQKDHSICLSERICLSHIYTIYRGRVEQNKESGYNIAVVVRISGISI